MSFEKDLDGLMVDLLEEGRDVSCELVYPDLSRDKFANKDFDEIFGEVADLIEELGLEPGDRRDEKKISALIVMFFSKFADEEGLTDRLSDREYRRIEENIASLEEVYHRIDSANRRDGRRGGRDDRDDRGRSSRRRGGRRGSRRDEFSASDRDSRSGGRGGRGSRDRDDRDERRPSSRRSKRDKKQDEPTTMVQRRAQQNREEQDNEERPKTSQEIARAERNRPKAQRAPESPTRDKRNHTFVGEPSVAEDDDAEQLYGSEAEVELGFSYAEVPVGTPDDYIDLGINIKDPEFIKTRPVDEADTFRDVLYDPFVKQPVWELSENGKRVLRWRDFNMNIDNHVIPDFKRSRVSPARSINKTVLASMTHPSRRSILDIASEQDKNDRKHEDALLEWETNNKDRPEDEQSPKPVLIDQIVIGNHTLRVPEPVNSGSVNDQIMETMNHFGQIRGFTKGHAPVESSGQIRTFAWMADSIEDRDSLMEKLEMFTTSHSHASSDNRNVIPIHKYHAALMAAADTVPSGLWKRVNRRMTDYCNDIFAINMGLDLSITDFAEDGDKIVQHLNDKYGERMVEAFVIGHSQSGDRISMLESSTGQSDMMIYEVRGTQVTILPVAPDELNISEIKVSSKSGSSALVTAETNLRLFNAVRTVATQSTPTMGKRVPYKYITFSDGSVFRIDRNALGLTGDDRRTEVEFMLTPMPNC